MNKSIYVASMIVLMLFACGLLIIGYLYFLDGGKVIEYSKEPMKIATVNADTLDVLIKYCRFKVMPLTTYPAYINGMIYNLKPEKVAGSGVGCFENHRLYNLPRDLPNGKYHFQVRNEFHINILRTIWKSWVSEEFEVQR